MVAAWTKAAVGVVVISGQLKRCGWDLPRNAAAVLLPLRQRRGLREGLQRQSRQVPQVREEARPTHTLFCSPHGSWGPRRMTISAEMMPVEITPIL